MRTVYTGGVTGTDKGASVRAVAYVRVSSEEQRKHGYSLDDQERELRVCWACRRGPRRSGAAPRST